MYEGVDPTHQNGESERDLPPRLLKADGIEIDYSAAFRHYQLSGTEAGTYRAAAMLEQGLVVDQNVSEATRLLELLAADTAADHCDSKFRLACLLESGLTDAIAKNEQEAAKAFQALIDEYSDVGAMCRLACMYRVGRGVSRDRSRAYALVSDFDDEAAYPDVCYLRASMLQEEVGAERDVPEATRLLKIAAKECNGGHLYYTDAQYLLACLWLGTNPRLAIRLLKSASSKEHVEATFRLACLFYDGKIVDFDLAEAARLFMSAVAKGHVDPCLQLATMHELGQGVARNCDIAAMLYGLVAEKGRCEAQYQLARLYKDGCGVVQNLTKSFELYRLSALQGAAHGQHGLACMYLDGSGTVRSRSEAVRWFQKAAAQGHGDSVASLQRLESNL